jgi:hypothetical protein
LPHLVRHPPRRLFRRPAQGADRAGTLRDALVLTQVGGALLPLDVDRRT